MASSPISVLLCLVLLSHITLIADKHDQSQGRDSRVVISNVLALLQAEAMNEEQKKKEKKRTKQ